ncbi:MAG: VOC family protein [Rhodospirillales bacterium]|nr:VOC family protein [Rhodospirillales bacterium]
MRFAVDRIDHVTLNCRDVDTTASWYQRVLGMEREEFGRQQRTCLKFGGQKLNLRPIDTDDPKWATGQAAVAGSADLCFATAVGPEEVATHLRRCGVAVELGPVERIGALGPMLSVYCRDPDGNLIEIATYLAG